MKLEFLLLEECPNAGPMLEALRSAVTQLPFTVSIDLLDIEVLARNGDRRAGYGSPTILVDGKDLFHAEYPAEAQVSCRLYHPSLPSTDEIRQRLLNYMDQQRISPEQTKEVRRRHGE